MSRNIVVLLDGTGNHLEEPYTNVFKLFHMLPRDEGQLVYYSGGVGTTPRRSWWGDWSQDVRDLFGLILGMGLDETILEAYSWLCRRWQPGDRIWLFGFSRGAYAARALAGLIHMCGLVERDQLNLCGYLLTAYKKSSESDDLEIAFKFQQMLGSRFVTIEFVGVWDTVASLLVPRRDLLYFPAQINLAFTRSNPSVRSFRQAIAIDERRSMYRIVPWQAAQSYRPSRFDRSSAVPQDIREVWFAGVHADVGGGYPEYESGLAKYPLLWMAVEAEQAGLRIDPDLKRIWAEGMRDYSQSDYFVAPDPMAKIHNSLEGGWWLLEIVPKYWSMSEWPKRLTLFDFYLPWGEPRAIPHRSWKGQMPDTPFAIHSSVLERIARLPGYRPVNLPREFEVETTAGPPAPDLPATPPFRPETALERLRRLATRAPRGALRAMVQEGFWLAILLMVVGGYGGFVRWPSQVGLQSGMLLALALMTALVEEAAFRALLLKPPPEGAGAAGPAAASAALFALWLPLQGLICRSPGVGPCPIPWAWLGFSPLFLVAAFGLGLACARLVLRTGSIWPSVLLRWLVILAAALLFVKA